MTEASFRSPRMAPTLYGGEPHDAVNLERLERWRHRKATCDAVYRRLIQNGGAPDHRAMPNLRESLIQNVRRTTPGLVPRTYTTELL